MVAHGEASVARIGTDGAQAGPLVARSIRRMTALLVSSVLALAVTPLVIVGAQRWQLVDEPNHRSSHTRSTPRGGGIAVVLATIATTAALEWSRDVAALCAGGLTLAIVGLLDDRFTLPALPRLFAQLVVPLIAFAAVDGLVSAWLPLAVLFVAGYVNAFNFMDGINGISGLQAAAAAGYLAILASDLGAADLMVAGAAVVGAALGFLPYNMVHARIFLGDVGSYFLGFWLATLAVLTVEAGAAAPVVAAPFVLYGLDTSSVLVRRWRRGERLTEAHREHAYQRLVQAGASHPAVATLYAFVSALVSAMMYVVRDATTGDQAAMLVAGVAIVVGYLLIVEWVIRRSRAGREA